MHIAFALSVVAQLRDSLCQRIGLGHQGAAVADRAEVLGGIKAVGACHAEVAGWPATPARKVRLSAVLDQLDPSLVAEVYPCRHVSHLPVQMNQHHGAGPFRHAASRTVQRQQSAVGLDVGQHRCGTGPQDREHRGESGHRRGDHLGARADVKCTQRQLNGVHAVGDAHAVAGRALLCPNSLEGFHLVAEHIPAGGEHSSRRSGHRLA